MTRCRFDPWNDLLSASSLTTLVHSASCSLTTGRMRKQKRKVNITYSKSPWVWVVCKKQKKIFNFGLSVVEIKVAISAKQFFQEFIVMNIWWILRKCYERKLYLYTNLLWSYCTTSLAGLSWRPRSFFSLIFLKGKINLRQKKKDEPE